MGAKPAAGGKGGKADPKAAKPPTEKGGKKPQDGDTSTSLILMPKGARVNAGRSMRALAEAVLSMVGQLRSGVPLYTGVVPLLKGGGGKGVYRDTELEDDAASYVTSAFSFGSDLQVRK